MKIKTDDFETIRKQVMLGGVHKVGLYFSLFKWKWIYYAEIDEPAVYEDTDLDKEEAWATAVSFVVWCALIVLVVVYLIFVLVR